MSRLRLMTSFVDVILLYFTNFTTSSPFWTTRLEFYEIFTRSKVVQRDLRNTLKNLFLIQCRVFDSWRQLWRHFALSHQLVYLIAFLSDLTWFLRNIYDESNCSTRLKNILAKSLFDRMSRFLLMTSFLTSFCSISLTFPLNRLFEDFNLIFTKYL